MINGSTAFNNAVIAGGYPYIVRISDADGVIECDVLACSSYKGSVGTESFGVGTIFVPYVELEIARLNKVLENVELRVDVGVQINTTTTEWITLGYYKVVDVKKSTVRTSIKAVGRLTTTLQLIFPSISGTVTISSVISAIQTAVRNAGFSTFTLTTVGITLSQEVITADLNNLNCRQLIEIITSLVGGYATEDNSGNIVIFKYATTPTVQYDGAYMITHPVVSDFDFTLSNIKVIKTEERQLDDGTIIPEVSFQYDVETQPSLIVVNHYMENSTMFATFCNNCIGLTYRPATITLAHGDPRLEAVDVLKIVDTNGAEYIVPAFSVVNAFTGGITTTIIAPGQSQTETDSSIKGPITQQIDTLTSSVASAQISATSAKSAAASAQQSALAAAALANAAQSSADAAQTSANAAQSSADAAQADATLAKTEANTAKTQAQEAKTQAETATTFANNALSQLGVVEDVVDTLTWISAHGEYEHTEDPVVQEGKTYYTLVGTAVSNPIDDDVWKYYEVINGAYAKTQDIAVIGGKTYYTVEGTVVPVPQTADIATYYELDLKDVVSNYIQSHIALTDEGLSVLSDGNGWRLLITSDGVKVIDSAGQVVSKFGDNVEFSALTPQRIGSENSYVMFDPTTDSITISGQGVTFSNVPMSNILNDLYGDGTLNGVVSRTATLEDKVDTFSDNIDEINEAREAAVETLQSEYNALATSTGNSIASLQDFINQYIGDAGYIRINNTGTNPSLEIGKSIAGSRFYVRLSSTEMGFYQDNDRVAYINDSKLFIKTSEITDEQRIGNFLWAVRNSKNRISLRYSPE